MWWMVPHRITIVGGLVAGLALPLAGPAKKLKDAPPPKVEEVVGDVANIIGTDFTIEGVGLVVGLDGTGSDPAPSGDRNKLIEQMQKAGIEHPERILRMPSVSMVKVKATMLAGVAIGDKFDVQIELPPASTTSSLAGGFLIETKLAQRAMLKNGDVKDDKVIAAALGPVLIGTPDAPEDGKVGRVLGGGRPREDSPYLLSIKSNRQSGKTSQLLENVVNRRFHATEGMARAKTDAALILKVPENYHHNQDRYHAVIKYLNLVDNPNLQQQRIEKWGKELLDPKQAGLAALRLEGLGPIAAPALKAALGSPDATVRFFAAEALAYVNDPEGASVLAETTKQKPEFRLFALKALAALNQSAAHMKLRALMNEPEAEVRYGAFDALRTLEPTDIFLGRKAVLDEKPNPDVEDAMALQVAGVEGLRPPRPRRARPEPFALYVVDCEGPPMIHVTRNTRCEVVIFGRDQRMLTPIVLGSGGPLLLNASDGDAQVQISKITAKTLDAVENKVNSSLEVAEVIRRMANLGATYPEIALVLGSASTQKNLPGPFAIDALPNATKAYDEAQLAGLAKKDDALKRTSAEESRPSLLRRMGSLFKR